MELKEQLSYNLLFVGLGLIVYTVFSFFVKVLLAKIMPPEAFGMYSTTLNLAITISTLTVLGLPGALVKIISESKNKQRAKRYLNFSLKFVFKTSLSASIIIIIFSNQISEILKLTVTQLYLLAISIPIITVFFIYYSFNYGLQRMKRLFEATLLRYVVLISLIGVAVLSKTLTPGLAFFLEIIGITVAILILFERPGKSIKNKKRLLKFSAANFASIISENVIALTPFIIIPALMSQSEMGLFSFLLTLSQPIVFISAIFIRSTFPIFSYYASKPDITSKLFGLIVRYVFTVSLPILILMALYSEQILILLASENYAVVSSLLAPVMLGILSLMLFRSFNMVLFSLGKIRKVIELRTLSLLFLPTFLVLTKFYGLYGAAISYMLSFFAVSLISFLVLKTYVRIRINIKKTILFLFATSIFFAFAYYSRYTNLTVKLALTLASLIFYLIVLFKSDIMKKEEIYEIISYLLRASGLKNRRR